MKKLLLCLLALVLLESLSGCASLDKIGKIYSVFAEHTAVKKKTAQNEITYKDETHGFTLFVTYHGVNQISADDFEKVRENIHLALYYMTIDLNKIKLDDQLDVYFDSKDKSDDTYADIDEIHFYQLKDLNKAYYYLLIEALTSPGDYKDNGNIPLEGLGYYFEEEYGPKYYGLKSNSFMKFYLENNTKLDWNKLITEKGYDDYLYVDDKKTGDTADLDNFEAMLGDNQIDSFCDFLIDTYGMDKYEKWFLSPDVEKGLKTVYGKDINQLQKEWILYVKNGNWDPLSNSDKKIQFSWIQFYKDIKSGGNGILKENNTDKSSHKDINPA